MKHIHSMILLGTVVAGATACSASPDGAPSNSSATSHVSTAESTASISDRHGHRHGAIVPQLAKHTPTMEATTPDNGDQNPYGIAFVPRGFPAGGLLRPGDVIVSNFNNSQASGNLQGTGTTLVRTNDMGNPPDVFFTSPNPGLSTALGALRRGFVIVGNVPSTPTSPTTMLGQCNVLQQDVGQGQLTVLDRHANVVAILDDLPFVNGPWDLTIDDLDDHARVYVSNVLSGTVARIDLAVGWDTVQVKSEHQIASGYQIACNQSAFVVGPTGLARDVDRDVLYVASTMDNAIYEVKDASDRCTDSGTGRIVVNDSAHLHGPLGLVRAANGNLISAQGDAVNGDANQPSEIVEFTKDGHFVDQISVDMAQGGAFGIALDQKEDDPDDFRFAAVDDNVPNVLIWDVK
jgi:hypothetical protein